MSSCTRVARTHGFGLRTRGPGPGPGVRASRTGVLGGPDRPGWPPLAWVRAFRIEFTDRSKTHPKTPQNGNFHGIRLDKDGSPARCALFGSSLQTGLRTRVLGVRAGVRATWTRARGGPGIPDRGPGLPDPGSGPRTRDPGIWAPGRRKPLFLMVPGKIAVLTLPG